MAFKGVKGHWTMKGPISLKRSFWLFAIDTISDLTEKSAPGLILYDKEDIEMSHRTAGASSEVGCLDISVRMKPNHLLCALA